MAYDKSKDLAKRTQSDKNLRDKAFKIASDPKHNGYQRRLASIRLKRTKVYSSFRDNIRGIDLADMQWLSKYIKENKYLLCAIDFFDKYAWVVPLKDKKWTRIVNAFQEIISNGRKPNKIWVEQGGKFYNKLLRINQVFENK